MSKKYLMKTEPSVYSIDDLSRDKVTQWDSIRNYQARNIMQDMVVGDEVLIYHSNAKPPGIAGLGVISETAFPDPTQFDKKSDYYDQKATKENPRWFCPEVKFVKKFKNFVGLPDLREEKSLSEMMVLRRGARLSVQPVSAKDFKKILKMAGE
jgi:predicted RNA-binding protein with PUA-like domain